MLLFFFLLNLGYRMENSRLCETARPWFIRDRYLSVLINSEPETSLLKDPSQDSKTVLSGDNFEIMVQITQIK